MADIKHLAGKIVVLALSCSLAGGVVGVGGMIAYNSLTKTSNSSIKETETAEILLGDRDVAELSASYVNTGSEMSVSEIYAANVNSTVGITTSVTTNYFGYQTTAAASGSGFIISSNGYILTNNHVIDDANEIKVTMYDGTVYGAELIGCDESNDIAVLKIDAKDLTPVVLGDSDNMMVGDSVIAIGNPLGELTFSLTQGVVSALDRKVTIEDTAMNLIQTDCAINAGNSGGALFNKYGEVIGITNAKYSSRSTSEASIDNVGFAIPVNSILDTVKSIIENGYIVKPYVGVSLVGLGNNYQIRGVIVGRVEDDSPAEEAGLEVNDVIMAVNGTDVSTVSDFKSIISSSNIGDVLELTVYRGGDTLSIDVELAVRYQSALPEN